MELVVGNQSGAARAKLKEVWESNAIDIDAGEALKRILTSWQWRKQRPKRRNVKNRKLRNSTASYPKSALKTRFVMQKAFQDINSLPEKINIPAHWPLYSFPSIPLKCYCIFYHQNILISSNQCIRGLDLDSLYASFFKRIVKHERWSNSGWSTNIEVLNTGFWPRVRGLVSCKDEHFEYPVDAIAR